MRSEHILLCGVVLVSFTLFLPVVFAYDDQTTHPALTNEIVEFYNLTHPSQKLTDEERAWLIEGSKLEDTAPRWINHFYDPVHKVGWTGEKEGSMPALAVQALALIGFSQDRPLSAVEWVNSDAQAYQYYRYGGDNTWKKALEYYVSQDKRDAYLALGHVLHLLEDMAVPDHTRNDTHANIAGIDEGSPYEAYASRYDIQNIKNLNIAADLTRVGASEVGKATIEEYLASLAEYSNKHFFSKDTINDPKFEFPKIVRSDGNFGYGKDENGGEFLLVKEKQQKDLNKEFRDIYLIENLREYYPIFESYFSHLAKQAVLYGAGVIDRFYASVPDAEIARDIPTHLYKWDPTFVGLFNFSLWGELVRAGNAIAANAAAAGRWLANVAGVLHTTVKNTGVPLATSVVSDMSRVIAPPLSPSLPSENETLAIANVEEDDSPSVVVAMSDQAADDARIGIADASSTATSINLTTTNTALRFAVFGGGSGSAPRELHCAGPIKITEIMYDASGSDEGKEWIEVFNAGTTPITLTDARLVGGDSGHLIKAIRGGAELVPGAYAIIANDGAQFVLDHPNYFGPVFHSAFSLPNDSGRVSVRCGSSVLHEVSYSSAIGARGDGASLQYDGEWFAAVPTIGFAATRRGSIIADFTYAPADPAAESSVLFNAASSTCTRCAIASYAWDFGDGETASSTNATTSRAYAGAGDRTVTLLTTSDMGATSTRSALVHIAPKPEVLRSILVSEVQVSGATAHDEFIELYNPNEASVPLAGYSIQYVSGRATSTAKVSKKNFSSDSYVDGHGFYLLANADATSALKERANMTYSGFSLSGEPSGGIIFLSTHATPIVDARDTAIADRVAYGTVALADITVAPLPPAGKSIERKANATSTADSMMGGADAFEGNGYNVGDNASDFVMREAPFAQNVANYPEPRKAPTAPVGVDGTTGSIGSYSSSTATISLVWVPASDVRGATSTIAYELYRTDGGSTKVAETTSTSYAVSPVAEGHTYEFALIAKDAEGLRSTTSAFAVDAPKTPTLFPQFAYEPATVVDGDLVRFDPSASRSTADPITKYEWDFGDGTYTSSSNSFVLTHTYHGAGDRVAKLVITDSGGATSTATSSVISVAPRAPTDHYSYEDTTGGDVQMPYQAGDVVQYLGSGLRGSFTEVGAYHSSCCGYYPSQHVRIYESDAYEGAPRVEIFNAAADVREAGWHTFVGATSTLNPMKHYWLRAPGAYASYPLHPGKGTAYTQYEYCPFSYEGDGYYPHNFIGGDPHLLFARDVNGRMAYRIPVVQ